MRDILVFHKSGSGSRTVHGIDSDSEFYVRNLGVDEAGPSLSKTNYMMSGGSIQLNVNFGRTLFLSGLIGRVTLTKEFAENGVEASVWQPSGSALI